MTALVPFKAYPGRNHRHFGPDELRQVYINADDILTLTEGGYELAHPKDPTYTTRTGTLVALRSCQDRKDPKVWFSYVVPAPIEKVADRISKALAEPTEHEQRIAKALDRIAYANSVAAEVT